MRKFIALAALAVATFASPLAVAQPDNAEAVAELKAMRAEAQKDKRALVASTLKLTDAEAKKFWPVYDAYQRDLENYRRERNLALEEWVMRDQPMTNRYAKNFTNELLKLEELEIKARRKMHNKAMRALPPKKAAQYLQIEFKLRAAQAWDIAVGFPLEK
jgi:Spy/CpxP family protein refolding chaperone